MIIRLLSRVPEVRLGGSYPSLKGNPWFENFDWVSDFFKILGQINR